MALCCFLALLAAYRLTLIRTGHFFWGDEIRYLRAVELIDDVARGDYRSAAGRLFQSLGRPGFILISVVPTWLSRIVYPDALSNVNPLAPYDAAAIFNVVVSLVITIAIYALARAWRMRGGYALLAAVTYSLLAQSNVWIKHLVPYNESLLLFLIALWLLSRKTCTDPKSFRWITLAGGLSAFAFATYPGHYMFVVVNFVCVVLSLQTSGEVSRLDNIRPHLSRAHRIKRTFAFCIGAAVSVLFFECLARYAGTTWIGSTSQFSPTMGLLSEGYVFAWHYLINAEGLVGLILAVLFVLFIGRAVYYRRMDSAAVASLIAIACYLIHATLGVVFHKTVFYGRILLMYVPFVVIGAVLAIEGIRSAAVRRIATCMILLATCYSFVQFAWSYSKLTYPADFWYDAVAVDSNAKLLSPDELYGSRDGSPFGLSHQTDQWFSMVADTQPEGSNAYVPLANHQDEGLGKSRLIGVNIRWMFYISENNDRFQAPSSHGLIGEAIHPLAFPPLQFEGFRPCERKRMQERQYTMRIYQRNDEVHSQPDASLAAR